MSNKQAAQIKAAEIAIEKLKNCDDVNSRIIKAGFEIGSDGKFKARVFGLDVIIDTKDFSMILQGKDVPLKVGDKIIVLHYLLSDFANTLTGDFVTFRDFTGGQFYWGPFLSRSVKPLVSKIGNDLDLLKKNLAKFDYTEVACGDFAADIHIMADVYVRLIYRLGDDEFAPSADVLFDSSLKRIFVAEDTAVIASRICIGLLF